MDKPKLPDMAFGPVKRMTRAITLLLRIRIMGAAKSFQEILDQEIQKNMEPNLDLNSKTQDNFKTSESVFLRKLAESLGQLSPSKTFVQKTYASQTPSEKTERRSEPQQKHQQANSSQAPKLETPKAETPRVKVPPPQRVKRSLTFDQTTALKLFNSHGYQLDEWSTDSEIKKAYRMLAKKFHPDRVTSTHQNEKRSAEETFKSIARAFSHFDI